MSIAYFDVFVVRQKIKLLLNTKQNSIFNEILHFLIVTILTSSDESKSPPSGIGGINVEGRALSTSSLLPLKENKNFRSEF